MTQSLPIAIPKYQITEFCQKHHIRKLALFGSVLRNDFHSESDIDVLVEFQPEHIPGLSFFAMQTELSELLGHPVDLNTPNFLSPRFREEVITHALVQYVQP